MERGTTVKTDRVLGGIVKLLEKFTGISKAVLFGSRAQGDHRPESDYDIAVYPVLQSFYEKFQLHEQLDDWDTRY